MHLGAQVYSQSREFPSLAYAPNGQQRDAGYENGSFVHPTTGEYHLPNNVPCPGYVQVTKPTNGVHGSSTPSSTKNTRAPQACIQCRKIKGKCDGNNPCKACHDKGVNCDYLVLKSKAPDERQKSIMEAIGKLEKSLESLTTDRVTKQDLASFEKRLNDKLARIEAVVTGHQTENYIKTLGRFDAGAEHMPMCIMEENEFEAELGQLVPPGEPALLINHTTRASSLLGWPIIADIVKDHLEREGVRHIGEYPISLEQDRGILSIYGRGGDSSLSRCAREIKDPRALGGNPDFSKPIVWEYVESFREHILNMHPIIQPEILHGWVQNFLDNLPCKSMQSMSQERSSKGTPFAVGGMTTSTMTKTTRPKRKRSPERDGPELGPRLERSIDNALVLTILALGKMCRHNDRIDDALHQFEPISHGSPLTKNRISTSPGQSSSPSIPAHSHSSGGAVTLARKPERGFQSGPFSSGSGLKKNYEAVPGLEYFAFATDILGNNTGAYTMKNVFTLIFAALFHGQLARPMESFSFIHQASHKLQVIIRPSLDALRRIKKAKKPEERFPQTPEHNELTLTFWTCLQLESDLIAEMQLPPSELLSYEEDMPHPNMSLWKGFDQRILDSYLGQLYLRKHLNNIHRIFYAPNTNKEETGEEGMDPNFSNVGLVSAGVLNMQWAAKSFAFTESDPPANDILDARLRAKYWGAQVITYRPFIRQILSWSDNRRKSSSSPNMQPVSESRQGVVDAPVIDRSAKCPQGIQPEVIEYAKEGIKALIESTRAFHNLGENRPIITNVFETAHAQWGNLLVLSACSKIEMLSRHVDAVLLRTLFDKTIQFLRQSSTPTSSLETDSRILKGIQQDLFPPEVSMNMTEDPLPSQVYI